MPRPLPHWFLLAVLDSGHGESGNKSTLQSPVTHLDIPGSSLRDVGCNTLKFELQICLLALTPQFTMSYLAKPLPPLLYLDDLKTLKALNGEGWES